MAGAQNGIAIAFWPKVPRGVCPNFPPKNWAGLLDIPVNSKKIVNTSGETRKLLNALPESQCSFRQFAKQQAEEGMGHNSSRK